MDGKFLSFVYIGPKVRLGWCFCFLLLVLFVSFAGAGCIGIGIIRTVS